MALVVAQVPTRLLVILLGVALLSLPSVAVAPPAAKAQTDVCSGAPRNPFTDVPAAHVPAVNCLLWYEITRGTTPDTFGPDRYLTRAEAAAFAYRSLQTTGRSLPATRSPRFTDLAGNGHRDVIERLARAGIVQGVTATRFGPSERISRAVLADWLLGIREATGRASPGSPANAFDDDEGHRLEHRIDQAAASGIALPISSRRFAPDVAARRHHAAAFTRGLLVRLGRDGTLTRRPVRFEARTRTIPTSMRRQMTGVSWHRGCPVAIDDLRLIELIHRDLRGGRSWGQLVVHRSHATSVRRAMRDLYAAGFAMRRVFPVDRYGGDDARSMRNNNTSAFNCRRVAGTSRWSEHAYGRAIDINPVQNPYVSRSTVQPEAGREYLDRRDVRPGMLVRGQAGVRAFDAIGWGWGGDWSSVKDHQHFSSTGR